MQSRTATVVFETGATRSANCTQSCSVLCCSNARHEFFSILSYTAFGTLRVSTNLQLITQCAAKAVQNQEKMSMRDIRGSGKALAKDMRRAALTRKKSRVEEKVSAFKQLSSRSTANLQHRNMQESCVD
jgi:hypothetical protein